MPTRRAIRGVLHNFIGTYTSRYSDYDGYWLFGFVVEKIDQLECDLWPASSAEGARSPLAVAGKLAAEKFQEQARKAGILARIARAKLRITTLPAPVQKEVNGHVCTGHLLRFHATAVSDRGAEYECEKTIFAVPHSPWREWRRQSCGTPWPFIL